MAQRLSPAAIASVTVVSDDSWQPRAAERGVDRQQVGAGVAACGLAASRAARRCRGARRDRPRGSGWQVDAALVAGGDGVGHDRVGRLVAPLAADRGVDRHQVGAGRGSLCPGRSRAARRCRGSGVVGLGVGMAGAQRLSPAVIASVTIGSDDWWHRSQPARCGSATGWCRGGSLCPGSSRAAGGDVQRRLVTRVRMAGDAALVAGGDRGGHVRVVDCVAAGAGEGVVDRHVGEHVGDEVGAGVAPEPWQRRAGIAVLCSAAWSACGMAGDTALSPAAIAAVTSGSVDAWQPAQASACGSAPGWCRAWQPVPWHVAGIVVSCSGGPWRRGMAGVAVLVFVAIALTTSGSVESGSPRSRRPGGSARGWSGCGIRCPGTTRASSSRAATMWPPPAGWQASHALLPVAIAVTTSGSVLSWQVLQVKAPPASGVRPLCSTVSEGLWHGVHPVTSAGMCMSEGVPGWPSEMSWQSPQFGPSPWSMPAWQLLQSTAVMGMSVAGGGSTMPVSE